MLDSCLAERWRARALLLRKWCLRGVGRQDGDGIDRRESTEGFIRAKLGRKRGLPSVEIQDTVVIAR
jgi:hypothetical protein